SALSPNEPSGTIVTLGTPFMDTMSQILKRGRIDVFSWIAFAIMMLSVAYLDVTTNEGVKDWRTYLAKPTFFLPVVLVAVLAARQWFGRTHSTAQVWPPFLAIGSSMDEAWQILNHMRNIPNPLAIRSNVLSYLFSSMRSRMSRNKQVARIYKKVGLFESVVVISFLVAFVVSMLSIFYPRDTDWSKALNFDFDFAIKFVAVCASVMATSAISLL